MRSLLWLKRFSIFTAVSTFVLVLAGAFVTSTESGLAVPDWPLSYGMFFPPMVGGIFYEHGHRLIAAAVGFFVLVMTIWTQFFSATPRNVKVLTWIALFAVIVQGTLGGLTVIYLLPDAISISHACLGQTFFCIVVLAAYSRTDWFRGIKRSASSSSFPRCLLALFAVTYFQLIFGATMRHTEAGLAIPDFPAFFGHWWPPTWNFKIFIHFLHRMWALVVFSLQLYCLSRAWKSRKEEAWMFFLNAGLVALTLVQITLGAFVIWTGKQPLITSLHVVIGASILATTFVFFVTSVKRFGFDRRFFFDYWILGKPRITLFVTLSSFIGLFMAYQGDMPFRLAGWTCLATAMVAFGASTLNQFMEPDVDAKMNRTSYRPIPAGRVSKKGALLFGVFITFLGLVIFIFQVNVLAAIVSISTSLSYLLLYTPLKRISSLCTIVGAIPGALPPVIGWVAVTNSFSSEAWIIFAILFLWQLPHFLAISWLYNDDYSRANLPMLTVLDPEGAAVGSQLFLYASALLPVALLPSMVGMTGRLYFYGVFLLGMGYLFLSMELKNKKTNLQAKNLLLGSVIYLPLLFLLMAIDKR